MQENTQSQLISSPVQVIAVTAGKGGVGKTNIALGLAMCLSKLQSQVMLFDADIGLSNINVLLGLQTKLTLSHVLDGSCQLADIILTGPDRIQIIPSALTLESAPSFNQRDYAGIINGFSDLTQPLDYLVIDTASGIADHVLPFISAAQEVVLVVCDEPTSIADTFALIQLLHKKHQLNRFHVIANMVTSQSEGRDIYTQINSVTETYLNLTLHYLGAIPFDSALKAAVKQQQAVIQAYPKCPASQQLVQIAEKIQQWPIKENIDSAPTFFIERFISPQLGK